MVLVFSCGGFFVFWNSDSVCVSGALESVQKRQGHSRKDRVFCQVSNLVVVCTEYLSLGTFHVHENRWVTVIV